RKTKAFISIGKPTAMMHCARFWFRNLNYTGRSTEHFLRISWGLTMSVLAIWRSGKGRRWASQAPNWRVFGDAQNWAALSGFGDRECQWNQPISSSPRAKPGGPENATWAGTTPVLGGTARPKPTRCGSGVVPAHVATMSRKDFRQKENR